MSHTPVAGVLPDEWASLLVQYVMSASALWGSGVRVLALCGHTVKWQVGSSMILQVLTRTTMLAVVIAVLTMILILKTLVTMGTAKATQCTQLWQS